MISSAGVVVGEDYDVAVSQILCGSVWQTISRTAESESWKARLAKSVAVLFAFRPIDRSIHRFEPVRIHNAGIRANHICLRLGRLPSRSAIAGHAIPIYVTTRCAFDLDPYRETVPTVDVPANLIRPDSWAFDVGNEDGARPIALDVTLFWKFLWRSRTSRVRGLMLHRRERSI
jgi:hypothetical protein